MGDPVGDQGERIAYLPPRAVRARKLILRSQLGLPWMLAALAFAALILVAGVLLVTQQGRPGAPWVRVGPAGDFPAGTVTQVRGLDGDVVVVDRRGGAVRAFRVAAADCDVVADADGFTRPCTTESWTADGAPADGSGAGLTPLPAQLASGDLYVDPGP